MPDYIYFCGRPVPIHMPSGASVKSFKDDPSISFYTLNERYQAIAQREHPTSGRNYGIRHGGEDYPDFATLEAANANPADTKFAAFVASLGGNETDQGKNIYQIAIHYDATGSAKQTFGVLCSRGLSTHFCIDQDGNLYQYLDCAHIAWATNACSMHSIAVDMHNPVNVKAKSYNRLKVARTIERGVIQGKNREMLGYFDAQFDTFVALLKALTSPVPGYADPGLTDWIPLRRFGNNRFAPPSENGVDVIDHLVSGIEKFEGMIGHYHCNPEKMDPGPAFDWHRILRAMSGVKNSLPIDYQGKHDIGQFGNAAGRAFQGLCLNAERDASGGWYPIGANQSWHSGIHLATKEKAPVYNMVEGRIVAVRNVRHTDLGDPSFVLIEHDRNDPNDTSDSPKKIHWYSLYMHLRQWTEKSAKCEIPWIKSLLGNKFENAAAYSGYDRKEETMHLLPPVFEAELPEQDETDDEGMNKLCKLFFHGHILAVSIPVEVGELLGYAGKFVTVNTAANGDDDDGYDDLPNMIHLEAFSAKQPTDLFVRGEADFENWTIIEGANDEMSKAAIRTVLSPIQRFVTMRDGNVANLLKTSEISDFFSSDENEATIEKYRHFVCRHMSEWSPRMNWTDTAINTVGWQWESEKSFGKWYAQWLPFQWMTQELLDTLDINLDDGCVYTYHPIFLLEQLNKSFSGGSRNASGASEEEINQFKDAQKQKLEQLKLLRKKVENGETLTPEEAAAIEAASDALDDSLANAKEYEAASNSEFDGYMISTDFNKQDYGEWPVPKGGAVDEDEDDEDS